MTPQNLNPSSRPSVHFIGICGVGTSAVAIALHNAGYKITGSDKGFYPPVSTALENAGIKFYAGFHPERLLVGGTPDIIIAGGSGTGSSNPEILWAKEHNIPVLSFAEFIGTHFIKKNSVVTVGTWGKTSTSAILAHILIQAGLHPSYMIGGLPINLDSGKLNTGDWSVIEGDEYQSAIWDRRPKFAYYSPTHLLLTSVSWDHADLYPTEDAYFTEFEKLVESIPESGLIIACIDNPGVRKIIGNAKCKVVTYGSRSSADYRYVKVGESRTGLRFGIHHNKESYAIESQMIGGFQAENITGAFALAKEIGIETKIISSSIASFIGIKRRFEKRLEKINSGGSSVTLFDCHAPTPEKARACLRDLRNIYDKEKIIAIYEPNIGGRTQESAIKYTDAFSSADVVIIPRLTSLKVDPKATHKPMESRELAQLIARAHSNVRYLPNDEQLVTQVTELTRLAAGQLSDLEVQPPSEGSVVVFLGSHGFRGMIEEVIEKLKSVST